MEDNEETKVSKKSDVKSNVESIQNRNESVVENNQINEVSEKKEEVQKNKKVKKKINLNNGMTICMSCIAIILVCIGIVAISYNIFYRWFETAEENKLDTVVNSSSIEEQVNNPPEMVVDLKDYEAERLEQERLQKEEEERMQQEEQKRQEELKKQEEQRKQQQATAPTGEFAYYIKVNRSANTVTIYGKDNDGYYTVPVKAMVCSTGAATPNSGVYKTPQKARWGTLIGPVYGQYCTRITGQILFHSVPYLKYNDNSSLEYWEYDRLGEARSMGCIRLTVADAKWIFDNCPLGTSVEFYSSSVPGPLGKPSAPKVSNSGEVLRGWDPTDPDVNNPWRTQYVAPTPTPTPVLTATPTPTPTATPTPTPTAVPTQRPTVTPTPTPTAVPTQRPTTTPTPTPTRVVTPTPTPTNSQNPENSTITSVDAYNAKRDIDTLDVDSTEVNRNSTVDIMSYIFNLYTF